MSLRVFEKSNSGSDCRVLEPQCKPKPPLMKGMWVSWRTCYQRTPWDIILGVNNVGSTNLLHVLHVERCASCICLCAVCETAGYLMSYWNRPFFPEWCGDPTLDNSETYDTMTRIGASYSGFALSFKAVADYYGWTHIVLVSDDNTYYTCWYGAQPFQDVFGHNENYTFTWLRLGFYPTDEHLDDILQQIRSRARGSLDALYFIYILRQASAAAMRFRYLIKKAYYFVFA